MTLNRKQQEQTIALCQALVRHPSLSGEEGAVASVLKSHMQENGFDEVRVDEYGSVIGCIKGKYPGQRILFDGHIDVVPVPDASVWEYEPFGADRVNGRIYGRGTTDMKGAVAAMTSAAGFYAESTNREFAGEIYVCGGVHEECFEGIAARSVSQTIQPDLVIIGEPSDLNLKIGQRGRAEIVVETFGVPAHSANPHKGVNAVLMMCQLIEELNQIEPPHDPVLGDGVAVLTDIISSPYPGASVVPSRCKATYDRRLLVGETPESVLKPFCEVIARMEDSIPDFRAKVSFARGSEQCYTGAEIKGERFFPGWYFEENEPFVQKVLSGLQSAGINPQIACYPFCTNASHYAGEAKINTIGFGPSKETLAHVIDEYIEETQLITATQGYIGICKAFLDRE